MLHSSASVGQQQLAKRTLGDPTAHVGKLPKFNVFSVVEFMAANDIVTSNRSLSQSILKNLATTKFRTQLHRLTGLITVILNYKRELP